METIRVLIADDHPLVRCGIRETLRAADDIALVGEASRGDEAQRLCQELQPDVLLLDLQMPGATATETIKYVQEACRATRVIILTAYDDEVYVRGMAALGVAGYMLKDEVADAMLGAIRSVMLGGRWFGERVLDILAAGKPAPPPAADEPVLSELEQRLLQCLMEGMRDKEIAQVLQLPARRVRDELSRKLYLTLGVETRTQAVAWGWKQGYGTVVEERTNARE
jgi:DNA-binding NarL/FixJ family response regulator